MEEIYEKESECLIQVLGIPTLDFVLSKQRTKFKKKKARHERRRSLEKSR